tara:strand:+ start:3704 stop:4576 length:873 start_codon:yes stop_codon:yes gene_type:complete
LITQLKKILIISFLFFLACKKREDISTLRYTTRTTHIYKENLSFDYYKPKKPNDFTIIYIHGGGFSKGKKDSKEIIQLAEDFGKNGYATISISYRLGLKGFNDNCKISASDKIRAFDIASKDIYNSINYILQNRHKLHINTDKIFISGISAGAEAILNLFYLIEEKTISQEIKFKGVISRSGAIRSLNCLDKIDIPLQLFHGTKDSIVPYDVGFHRNCIETEPGYLKLFGSKAIANHLKKSDKPYYLITLKNGDHGMKAFSYYDYVKECLLFLNSVRLNTFNKQIEKYYN